jgi:hypothetical protein
VKSVTSVWATASVQPLPGCSWASCYCSVVTAAEVVGDLGVTGTTADVGGSGGGLVLPGVDAEGEPDKRDNGHNGDDADRAGGHSDRPGW